MGKVISINISSEKGTVKESVPEVNVIENWGLDGDAHAGKWDRQVSILPIEAYELVPEERKQEVLNGGYTENFTISGIPLSDLKENTTLKIGEAIIKILYIGKDHFKEIGRPYIVSRQGRFGIVVKGGKVKCNDSVELV